MGGFTIIKLKDRSQQNIEHHNEILQAYKVSKKYRFYSEKDRKQEYEYYKKGDGTYPEHLFPKDKIHSYQDFKKYWSTEALGEAFVPPIGSLTFDCYFNRTKKYALRNLGRYVAAHVEEIESIEGSLPTFMERGMTQVERYRVERAGLNK